MRGFPKFFNTKQDYLNCLTLYPAQTKEALKLLARDRFIWVDKGIVQEDGIADDMHMVQETETANGNKEKHQYEYTEDPNARVFRLGFTLEEINKLVGE